MRVLVWNLFHGRSVPPAGRDLRGRFAEQIAAWEWDVALLQEVPPWWPPELAKASGAHQRFALTSRNTLLPVRRFIAERRPDVIKSNGGGANAILVRGERVVEHRVIKLRGRPERRVCHAVRLESGVWCANLHAQAFAATLARADIARAAHATLGWAAGAPALLGGDFNVREPTAEGFQRAGGDRVDHVLTSGLRPIGETVILERDRLSDHAPLLITLRRDRL